MQLHSNEVTMTQQALTLISHHLCPYVQRAAISFAEKNTPFERVDINLAKKPDWFLALSPLGKTPVLQVGRTAIFESSVILEYLEDTLSAPLHPSDPLKRAEHRSWIEFASAILSDIAGLYAADDFTKFEIKKDALSKKFAYVETHLTHAPYFAGTKFTLVDAAFAPVFRYFDVFDTLPDFDILTAKPKLQSWRAALAERPSVKTAVADTYNDDLIKFLGAKNSYLSSKLKT
jgi:glutathione S-transferase